MLKSRTSILIVLAITLMGCGPERVYEAYQDLPDSGWNVDNKLRFEMQVEDTINPHQIQLHFRHDEAYAYRNLYLFVTVLFPDQKALRDTINILMADPGGRWYGDGVGAVKHVAVILRDQIQLPMKGNYIFEFEQAMREEDLKGLNELGLEVIRLEN